MSAPSFQKALKAVGACAPLIHVMTNTISQNDCANLLLAIGARPIMAEAEEEAAEIAAGCAALVLNTGIPSRQKLRAMALAGKAANQKGIPVILDPVGIGASAFRRQNIFHLLGEVRFSLIRANSAEVCALAGQNPQFSGVDAASISINEGAQTALSVCRQTGAAVLQSGAQDLLVDGSQTRVVSGGHSLSSKVTGTGCMLSALAGAFLAANPGDRLSAAEAASSFWKACAERAAVRMQRCGAGTGSLRIFLIDAASQLAGQV